MFVFVLIDRGFGSVIPKIANRRCLCCVRYTSILTVNVKVSEGVWAILVPIGFIASLACLVGWFYVLFLVV